MKSLNGVGPVRRNVARGLALGVLLGSAGVGFALGAGPALADPTNNYDLSAQGDGMYILIEGPNLPAGLPGPVSPYASFSAITSNAVSRGFAGAPYLGPLVQTLPGLVGGLSGGTVPTLPELPGFVTSQDPNIPEAHETQAAYVLTTKSDPFSSKASVGLGIAAQAGSTPQAFSNTETTANEDGTTVARATAGATGVNVGPVSLLDVSSSISITTDVKGTPTVVNTTNLGTISIAGIKVGLTESGFTILGSNVAVPTKAVFDTLNTVLAAAKTKIDLLPGSTVKGDDGSLTVQSAGLQVSSTQDVPGVGDASFTYVFGRTTVKSKNLGTAGATTAGTTTTTGDGGAAAASTTGDPSTTTGGTDPSTSTSGDTAGGIVPGDSSTGASGDSSTGVPPIVADPVTGLPPVDNNPTTTGGGTTGGVQSIGNTFDAQLGNNTELLYLVLVLGGGAAFLGQQLFSRFGVKLLLRQG